MTDSRVTPQAVEAAAKALGVKPCRVDPKNWYSCGGDDDPTEGYSCSDWQCENQDHKGRRACDNPWHRVPAALAAAVPLLCQPLQDEIDRLRAEVARLEMAASTAAAAGAQDFATYLGRIADGVREQRS